MTSFVQIGQLIKSVLFFYVHTIKIIINYYVIKTHLLNKFGLSPDRNVLVILKNIIDFHFQDF